MFADLTAADREVWRQIVSRHRSWRQWRFLTSLLAGIAEREERDYQVMFIRSWWGDRVNSAMGRVD